LAYSFLWKSKVALVGTNDRFRGEIGKRFLVLIAIAAFVFVAAVSLIPSFQSTEFSNYPSTVRANSAECIQNTICRVFLYSYDYLSRDFYSPLNISREPVDSNTNIQMGRITLFKETFESVTEHGPLIMMFGYGASAVNPSYLLGEGRSDIMYQKFGMRGTYPSAIAVMMETGLVGLSAMVLFFSILLYSVMKRAVESSSEGNLVVGVTAILMILIIAFDYSIYSITAWSSYTLAPIFFIVLGFFLAHNSRIVEHWPMARGIN
jgi:O-antigen ligase